MPPRRLSLSSSSPRRTATAWTCSPSPTTVFRRIAGSDRADCSPVSGDVSAETSRGDADRIPGAKFRETGAVWGHFTMFNLREQDTAAIDAVYVDVLAS